MYAIIQIIAHLLTHPITFLFGILSFLPSSNHLHTPQRPASDLALSKSVDAFIKTETPIAWDRLLCNIAPGACAGPDAVVGVVIASPDTIDPPYFYTWTRDSALVLSLVIEEFIRGDNGSEHARSLSDLINGYVQVQARLQGVDNPSGSLQDGAGLGEPKYNVNLTAFTGSWGRPQSDGPALRAVTLITYAKWLLKHDGQSMVSNQLWPIIRNDLAYVAQYWNDTSFDLWEETKGSSFFTVAVQHQALRLGTQLAKSLGTSCKSCNDVAPHVLCFLQSFWSGSYIISNINTDGINRTGKDANSILASIHTFDPALSCDGATFQPCSDKALANHKAVTDSFRSVYKVNNGIPQGKAVAVGRYSEDVYYDGNPWHLTTLAAAEQLYDALFVWQKEQRVAITSTSEAFFQDLLSDVQVGEYRAGNSTYKAILDAVASYADGYVAVVEKYALTNGSLWEQFGKTTGEPLSASDLTWSYAAFLSAAARRASLVSEPWAEEPATSYPSVCSATSVSGEYSTVIIPVPTPTDGVLVTFRETVETAWGDTIKIVGNVDELGNWNVAKAVALDASQYSADSPIWTATVALARGRVYQYKYIRVNKDGIVFWELGPNRNLRIQNQSPSGFAQDDVWGDWHIASDEL